MASAQAWLESAEKRGVAFADPFRKTAVRSAEEDKRLRESRRASQWNESGPAQHDRWHVDHDAVQRQLSVQRGEIKPPSPSSLVVTASDQRRLGKKLAGIERRKALPEKWRRHDFAILAHGEAFASEIWRAPWVFLPASPVRLLWELAVLAMLLYILLSAPAEACFGVELPGRARFFFCNVPEHADGERRGPASIWG